MQFPLYVFMYKIESSLPNHYIKDTDKILLIRRGSSHYQRLPQQPLQHVTSAMQCAAIMSRLVMALGADIAFNDITIKMKNKEPHCKYGCAFSGM